MAKTTVIDLTVIFFNKIQVEGPTPTSITNPGVRVLFTFVLVIYTRVFISENVRSSVASIPLRAILLTPFEGCPWGLVRNQRDTLTFALRRFPPPYIEDPVRKPTATGQLTHSTTRSMHWAPDIPPHRNIYEKVRKRWGWCYLKKPKGHGEWCNKLHLVVCYLTVWMGVK